MDAPSRKRKGGGGGLGGGGLSGPAGALTAAQARAAMDGKFRTRFCQHWDASLGTFCPRRRQGKCDFAHGPFELRVKASRRARWGAAAFSASADGWGGRGGVDERGDHPNPRASGGEDTVGAARSVEQLRIEDGKVEGLKSKPRGGS